VSPIALCDAAASNNIEVLREIILCGGDANKGDYDKRTAIHLAASEGLLEVVKFLLEEAGADHSPKDRWGGTPLDDAKRHARAQVIDYLKSKGAKASARKSNEIDVSANALCDAAHSNNVEELRMIIAAGGEPNAGDYDKRTAIHLAASEGRLTVVQYLVGEAGANHSPEDRWGGTPLDDAMRHGHMDVIDFLKGKGAKATSTNAAALCDAAASHNIDELRNIHRAGGDMNAGDYDKRTAIHLAASEGSLDVVKFLVDEAGANHSPADRWGGTPLDDATRHHHSAVIDYLRSKGAKASGAGATAGDLCDLAHRGDVAKLRQLLKSGVDMSVGDYDKRTAIHLAASEGNLEVVKFLVDEAGIDPSPEDRWGGTPLDDAKRQSHTAVMEYLKSKAGKAGKPAGSSMCIVL